MAEADQDSAPIDAGCNVRRRAGAASVCGGGGVVVRDAVAADSGVSGLSVRLNVANGAVKGRMHSTASPKPQIRVITVGRTIGESVESCQ